MKSLFGHMVTKGRQPTAFIKKMGELLELLCHDESTISDRQKSTKKIQTFSSTIF